MDFEECLVGLGGLRGGVVEVWIWGLEGEYWLGGEGGLGERLLEGRGGGI